MIQMLIVILDCNIVGSRVLKLIVNCLPLIFFELRIRRKKNKFTGHFAHKCKTSVGIYKRWYWLTEKFDGGGKLINIVQFQGGNW